MSVSYIGHPAWRAGAKAERDAIFGDMNSKSRQLVDFVLVLAQQGDDQDQIVDYVALVYGPDLPYRKRVRICAHLLLGYKNTRRVQKVADRWRKK